MKPGWMSTKRALFDSVSPIASFDAFLRPWLQLTKTALCLPVACSAVFGYTLYRPVAHWPVLLVLLGVLFLACGAAAGNSLQEIEVDRLYARTGKRPLVTGRLRRADAWVACVLLILLGLTLLKICSPGYLPFSLGIVALIAYNGLYTPLKQISPFALLPGGLAGAVPPLIGMTAAGGQLLSTTSWLLFSLFFLWQIPHFFLVFFRHRQDYDQVGPPALMRQVSPGGEKRIFLVWQLALVTVILAFPLLLPQLLAVSKIFFLLLAGGMLAVGVVLRLNIHDRGSEQAFLWCNACFFLTLILVTGMQLWWGGGRYW